MIPAPNRSRHGVCRRLSLCVLAHGKASCADVQPPSTRYCEVTVLPLDFGMYCALSAPDFTARLHCEGRLCFPAA